MYSKQSLFLYSLKISLVMLHLVLHFYLKHFRRQYGVLEKAPSPNARTQCSVFEFQLCLLHSTWACRVPSVLQMMKVCKFGSHLGWLQETQSRSGWKQFHWYLFPLHQSTHGGRTLLEIHLFYFGLEQVRGVNLLTLLKCMHLHMSGTHLFTPSGFFFKILFIYF